MATPMTTQRTINDWPSTVQQHYRQLAAAIDDYPPGRVLMLGLGDAYIPQLRPDRQFDVIEWRDNCPPAPENCTVYIQDAFDLDHWPEGPFAVIVFDLNHPGPHVMLHEARNHPARLLAKLRNTPLIGTTWIADVPFLTTWRIP